MASQSSQGTGASFCGNCGAAVKAGSAACSVCGQPVADPTEQTGPPPPDYIPYCRSCGVGVPWGMGHTCQRCGVAPLCELHFRSETGLCLDCSAAPAYSSGPAAGQVSGLACRRCGSALFPDADFCPKCGAVVTAGTLQEAEYMGFWIRFAAFVADWIIAYLIAALVAAIIGISMTSGDVEPEQLQDVSIAIENFNYSFLFLFCGISAAYTVVMTAWKGQTLGKMLLRIQVVDADGNVPPWHKAVIRELLRGVILLALFPLGLLYVWVGFDARKRGPHDYLGGSYVVRKQRNAGTSNRGF